MFRPAALCLTLAAAACAPQEPVATLPPDLGVAGRIVTRDPVVQVGQSVAAFFRAPQAGQPAVAARAIAELEWLADSLPRNPRWQTANVLGLNGLVQARREARGALGIPASAPPQGVINGLAAAGTALEVGDQAMLARALPLAIFPLGPQETVRRLAAPPSVPSAMQAYWALAQGPSPQRRR